MAPLYSKHLPSRPATVGIAQGRELMRDDIESYLDTIFGSHRTMNAAREALARADKVLARRISERR